MKIHVSETNFDEVIKSSLFIASSDYEYALAKFVPAVDKLDIQRKALPKKYYDKLERDILDGCIMPPLTMAFVDPNAGRFASVEEATTYIQAHVEEVFVLDGIQRLNTLNRAYNASPLQLKQDRKLYVNFLVCQSEDKLLYRMITLNNGQRPMSARHQIEALTQYTFRFENLEISIRTEKEQSVHRVRGSFNKADFVKAYMAYVSQSINIDNEKIIESKMDELLVDKIIESNIPKRQFEFKEVVVMISRLIRANDTLDDWFRNVNNLIGFCVGVSYSFSIVKDISLPAFTEAIGRFEEAFQGISVSKIKLGLARRRAVERYFSEFGDLREMDPLNLLDLFSQFV